MRRMTAAIAACLATVLALPLKAADGGATTEFEQDRNQLQEMLTKRDLELFELNIEPLDLGQIIVRNRLGTQTGYHYLAFRVRNQATLDASELATKSKGYNEVLQAMTAQYQAAKIHTEGGVALRIEGIEGKDGVVLERQDSKIRSRKVRITATATDENGTRMRLLAEPERLPSVENFQFPDDGVATEGTLLNRVREAVEEKLGHKFLTTNELAKIELAPFDGVARIDVPDLESPQRDLHGWFVGEAYGVVIFDRLNDFGDRFTIQLAGSSNKFRTRGPVAEPGKKPDYFNTRTFRRTFVIQAERSGDEYSRDLGRFQIKRARYDWVESFQRIEQRRIGAESKWYLDRIVDDKGNLAPAVKDEFWPWYNAARAAHPDAGAALPDLESTIRKGR